MAPSLFGYCKAGTYEYNPAKAKQLLTEAGVKPGTKISFHHPTGRYVQDKEATQAVAGYLREVGLEPELQTMDWPSYISHHQRRAGREDRRTSSPTSAGRPRSSTPRSRCSSSGRATTRRPGSPPASTRTPRWTSWIVAADRESNPEKRKALYCDIAKQVWADAPWLFLYVQRFPIVYSSKVTDVGLAAEREVLRDLRPPGQLSRRS